MPISAREGNPVMERKMAEVSLVDTIIRGQAEIDRMKTEIKTVTSTLVGWVKITSPLLSADVVIPCGETSPGDSIEWRFNSYAGVAPECMVRRGNHSSVLYSERYGVILLDVPIVHQTLEKFVEGLLERFPLLKRELLFPLSVVASQARKRRD